MASSLLCQYIVSDTTNYRGPSPMLYLTFIVHAPVVTTHILVSGHLTEAYNHHKERRRVTPPPPPFLVLK